MQCIEMLDKLRTEKLSFHYFGTVVGMIFSIILGSQSAKLNFYILIDIRSDPS